MKQSLLSTVALLMISGTTVPREDEPAPDTTVPREDSPNSPGEGPPDIGGPRERPGTTTVPREEE